MSCTRACGFAALTVVSLALSIPALAADEETWDGLVKVDSDRVQAAYLRPGADFRVYSRVIIDPPRVEFRKDWQRNINRDASTLSARLNSSDVERIRTAFAEGFEEILAAGFAKAGWDVGVADGPDVLQLTPLLLDVYVNAPDTMAPGVTTYTVRAGEAMLALEIRDAETDQLLGRVVDRRRTTDYGGGMLTVSNRVTNRAEFERLLKRWTDILTDGLAVLKEASPLGMRADD